MIVQQILLVNSLRNVLRTVGRIDILMFGCKGLKWVTGTLSFAFYTLTSVCTFSILFSKHFLGCWQGELVHQSIEYLVGDHFLYSYDLTVLYRGYTVRRKIRCQSLSFPSNILSLDTHPNHIFSGINLRKISWVFCLFVPFPIITRGFLASLRTWTALSTANGSARHLGGGGEQQIFLSVKKYFYCLIKIKLQILGLWGSILSSYRRPSLNLM